MNVGDVLFTRYSGRTLRNYVGRRAQGCRSKAMASYPDLAHPRIRVPRLVTPAYLELVLRRPRQGAVTSEFSD